MSTQSTITYQSVLGYLNTSVQFLNTTLSKPTQFVQNYLSLNMESCPRFLRAPLNFTASMLFLFFMILSFANNLLCTIVGVLYPVLYSMYTTRLQSGGTLQSATLNKYWVLYGIITMIDTVYGFVLSLIPGYVYLKLAITYALVRNNFAIVDMVYDTVSSLSESYIPTTFIQSRFEELMNKIKQLIPESSQQFINQQFMNEEVSTPSIEPIQTEVTQQNQNEEVSAPQIVPSTSQPTNEVVVPIEADSASQPTDEVVVPIESVSVPDAETTKE